MIDKIKKIYSFSNTWTGTVVFVLLVIFFIAQAFVIPSGSMKNTYRIGDFLLVKKFSYGIPIPHIPMLEIAVLPDFLDNGHLISADGPKRGDITVFRYPLEPKIHYVKRCVGVGGDVIMVRDKLLYLKPHEGDDFIKANYYPGQIVSINGELWIKEPYAYKHPGITHDPEITQDLMRYPEWVFNFGPIIVPDGEYFMMGDNREHSGDSRAWGFVPYKYIVGTPWFTYLSWESRSYDIVLNGGIHNAPDHIDLRKICKELPITSKECKAKWEKNRYIVRWDRMFKTPEGLEKLLKQ